MATIHFKSKVIADFGSLVNQAFNLKSPSRSTVPLLAYWADFDTRLPQFLDAIQHPVANDVRLTFEQTAAPSNGSGGASSTDLMIRSPSIVIAKEAKYTERKYPTVTKWLGMPRESNKLLVLKSWLQMINRATGSKLVVNDVLDITYQLIHRTASACTSPTAERRAVVYHCFDPVVKYRKYYDEQLQTLANLISAPEKLSFYLYETTLLKTMAFAQLQSRWQANKQQDFSNEVRLLLNRCEVATFSIPVVVKYPHSIPTKGTSLE